jgi:hypothetical protein
MPGWPGWPGYAGGGAESSWARAGSGNASAGACFDARRRLVVPSFEALGDGGINRPGEITISVARRRAFKHGHFVIPAMGGDKFGSCISSAIAFNGTHGGVESYTRDWVLLDKAWRILRL